MEVQDSKSLEVSSSSLLYANIALHFYDSLELLGSHGFKPGSCQTTSGPCLERGGYFIISSEYVLILYFFYEIILILDL